MNHVATTQTFVKNVITGTDGNDELTGGTGAGIMFGGLGDDTYYVDNVADGTQEDADAGTDEIRSTISYDLSMKGANIESLSLFGAAINATGNELDNVLTGNALANTLDGKQGADTLMGGAGNDIYTVDNVGDVVNEYPGDGIDTVKSSITYTLNSDQVENLTLLGAGNLNGTGNTLANIITGNSGNNTLEGGLGKDALIGSIGDDTYIVNLTTTNLLEDVVTEGASAGNDTVVLAGGNTSALATSTLSLGANIENLDASGATDVKLNLTGNALDNTLTGNNLANILDGGIGADTLIGGDGNDTYVINNAGDVITENDNGGDADWAQVKIATANLTYTLAGNVEKATLLNTAAFNLTGNDLNNTLTGNAAANILDGGLGADMLVGGLGNDTYKINDANDVILDTGGIDTVETDFVGSGFSSPDEYTLDVGLENLTLAGTADINGTGNSLANILRGNDGINTLRGLTGNDTYYVGSGDFVIEDSIAGSGTDLVYASGDFTLGANVENLTLLGTADLKGTGNTGANTITGNSGANVLDGGAGNDTLDGGAGKDTLIASWGDTINGGLNFDTLDIRTLGTLGADFKISGIASAFVLTSLATTGETVGKKITVSNVENIQLASETVSIEKFMAPPGATMLNGAVLVNGDSDDTTNDIPSFFDKIDVASSRLVDLSSFQLLGSDWNEQVWNPAALSQTLKYKSNDGSTLVGTYAHAPESDTKGSSAGTTTLTSGDGAISLTMSASDTWVDSNGDTSGSGTWSEKWGFNYLDTQGTVSLTDDVKASHSVSDGGSWRWNSTGWTDTETYAETDSYSTGRYSLNLSLVDVTSRAGTGEGQSDNTKNIDTLNLTSYSFKDAITHFAVSFSAKIVDDEFASENKQETATLNNVVWSTADYKLTATSVSQATSIANGLNLDGTELGVAGGVVDLANIEGDLTATFMDLILSGNNVVTITNASGQSFNAGAGNDTITGGAGGDELNGSIGADSMSGGAGDDTYFVDNLLDKVTETSAAGGIDTVESSVSWTLGNFVENLTLTGFADINGTGNTQSNVLIGNDGNNILDGKTGTDTFAGGAGDDTYVLDQEAELNNVTEDLTAGIDTLRITYANAMSSAKDIDLSDLTNHPHLANLENITVTGTGLFNLVGNDLNNVLVGNAAINELEGNDGDDMLAGGLGNDILTGGAGADTFRFDTALNKLTNVDAINDFTTGEDKMQLENAIFLKLTAIGELSTENFVSGAGAVAHDANDFILYNTDTGVLSYDADGSGVGVAVQFATLIGQPAAPTLANSDFLIT